MKNKKFHSVDIAKINQFTIEDICTGKGLAVKNLSYSAPIPATPIDSLDSHQETIPSSFHGYLGAVI